MEKVKFFLVNGFNVEGYVEHYSDEEVVISNGKNSGNIVILNPAKNIVFYCIYPERDIEQEEKLDRNYVAEIPQDEPEVHESDPYLRAKSIAELKMAQKKIEQEKIRQQLTTFNIGSSQKIFKYEYPRKLQNYDSPKETSDGDGSHLRKLRKL